MVLKYKLKMIPEILIKALSIIFIVLHACLVFAVDSEQELIENYFNKQQSTYYMEADQFLKSMGFEDYVKLASSQLKSSTSKSLSQVSTAALKLNVSYLKSLNASRNLANLLYMVLKSDLSAAQGKQNLIRNLLAQQLMPFPVISKEPLPESQITMIKNIPDINEAVQTKQEIYNARAVERFKQEKISLIKAFILLLNPSQQVKRSLSVWLDEQIALAIQDSYIYVTRQQNRFLGRALTLSYVKYLREQNFTNSESVLKSFLRQYDVYLENYINAQYVQKADNDQLGTYNLKSGDIALEYSHGRDAFFTSLVIEPSTEENIYMAILHKLQNSISDSFKFMDSVGYYNILDKKDTYRELSEKENDLYKTYWSTKYANGFSHAGIVEVRRDIRTGLAMGWIWDIYPERNKNGPVRLMTPEGFASSDKVLKVGFVSYSPELLLRSFKKQIKQRGYLEDVWVGQDSFMGTTDDGRIVPSQDSDISYKWKTRIDEQTVLSWTELPEIEARSWYFNQVLPRVFARIKSYTVGQDASLFADGFANGRNLFYCSQMILLAFLEGANLDLQNSEDKVLPIVSTFSASIKSALKFNIDRRLVSPNGLVWQKDIFLSLFSLFLNRESVERQETSVKPTVAEFYTDFLKTKDQDFDTLEIPLDEKSLKQIQEKDIAYDVES